MSTDYVIEENEGCKDGEFIGYTEICIDCGEKVNFSSNTVCYNCNYCEKCGCDCYDNIIFPQGL
jgi:hypothetical protein